MLTSFQYRSNIYIFFVILLLLSQVEGNSYVHKNGTENNNKTADGQFFISKDKMLWDKACEVKTMKISLNSEA